MLQRFGLTPFTVRINGKINTNHSMNNLTLQHSMLSTERREVDLVQNFCQGLFIYLYVFVQKLYVPSVPCSVGTLQHLIFLDECIPVIERHTESALSIYIQ